MLSELYSQRVSQRRNDTLIILQTKNRADSFFISGVAVKMHSPKKVLPSTYFRENKYSPVYISQVKITPGITFFLGHNYSFGMKRTHLHGHDFFFSTSILPLGRQFTQSLLFRIGSLWLGSL